LLVVRVCICLSVWDASHPKLLDGFGCHFAQQRRKVCLSLALRLRWRSSQGSRQESRKCGFLMSTVDNDSLAVISYSFARWQRSCINMCETSCIESNLLSCSILLFATVFFFLFIYPVYTSAVNTWSFVLI